MRFLANVNISNLQIIQSYMRYYKTKINKKMQQIICGNFFFVSLLKGKAALIAVLLKKTSPFYICTKVKKKIYLHVLILSFNTI